MKIENMDDLDEKRQCLTIVAKATDTKRSQLHFQFSNLNKNKINQFAFHHRNCRIFIISGKFLENLFKWIDIFSIVFFSSCRTLHCKQLIKDIHAFVFLGFTSEMLDSFHFEKQVSVGRYSLFEQKLLCF